MLQGFTVLLLCQLIGEIASNVTHAPLPGPVIGLILLLGALILRGHVPTPIAEASQGVLRYLGFFFVPAGVGVITQLDLLRQNWLVLAIALVVSAVLGLAVTGWVMQALDRRGYDHDIT